MTIEERIEQLRNQLHQYNHAYYNEDRSEVSDFEFDQLLKELQALEKAHPEYQDASSPTQRVGGSVTKNFQTLVHAERMYSLDNTYSPEELDSWIKRIEKLYGASIEDYTCELKFDGASINMTYVNGRLQKAVTRGDGTQGDEVTANVKTIKNVPLRLQGDYPHNLILEGRLFCP